MPYIDLDYYTNIYRGAAITPEEFERLLPKASDVLDSITNDFYQFNNLEEDIVWRADKFKKAVACQIEYFHEAGGNTSEKLNSSPQTFSAGRTSVSNVSRYNTSGKNESKSLVSEDVYMYLSRTGFLYRGVSTC